MILALIVGAWLEAETATEWENLFALRCPQYGMFYEQIPMEHRSKETS